MTSRFKIYRRLGLIENWSWSLLIFVSPFYVMFSVLFDAVLTDNASLLWGVIFIIATAVEVLLVYLFKKLFLVRLLTRFPQGWIGAVTAGKIQVARNAVVAVLAMEFGLLDSVNWPQRVLGAFFMGIALLVMFVIVSGSRVEHAVTMAKLTAVQRNLLNHRQESGALLELENERLLAQARALLLPRIEKVQELLAERKALGGVIEDLRDLIIQQIRPLSSELSAAAHKLAHEPAPTPVAKVKIEFMTPRVNLRSVMRPIQVFLLAGVGQWILIQLLFGTQEANSSIPAVVLGWLLVPVVRFLVPAHVIVTRGLAIWVLSALGLISGLPVYFYATSDATNINVHLMLSTLLTAPAISLIGFAIWTSLDLARTEAEKRISQDNDSLARETALFDQRMWLAKRAWSFVIHGTVQAAITAAITRLSSAPELEKYQIDLAMQDLDRAKAALSRTPVLDVDLPSAMSALSETWQGICTVNWQISERAKRALLRDSNARTCVNEIAKEAVSNAVRHGEAKNAWVEVHRSGDEVMQVSVSNDGRLLGSNFKEGVGSRMFEDLTLSYSIENNKSKGMVVVEAVLPIALLPQAGNGAGH